VLSRLDIKDRYRSGYDSILKDFYVPCLSAATLYRRGVGFFTTASLAIAIDGIQAFLRNQGTMRLVVSPQLNEEDIRAITNGYEERESVVEKAMIRGLHESMPDPKSRHLAFISWLVQQNILNIKVAISMTDSSIASYHEKLGIFTDATGNHVGFTGSSNETVNGLSANFERMDVFCSWKVGDSSRVPGLIKDFEDLWTDRAPGLQVFSFPAAVREELLRIAPPSSAERHLPVADSVVNAHPLLKVELKARQLEAVAAWRNANNRGILEMATGTGKTIAALACASSVPDLRLLMIAVPSAELVSQWVSALKTYTDFPIPVEAIGESRAWMERFFRKLIIGQSTDDRNGSMTCVVGLYSALAGEKVSRLMEDAGRIPGEKALLICDEVHNAGAKTYQAVLRSEFSLRLGLSATPIRKYDEAGNVVIEEYFEKTVYHFDIGKAIDAGVLAEYDYFIHAVYLSVDEYSDYEQLSRRIAAASASITSLDEELKQVLLMKRASILKTASGKEEALSRLLSKTKLTRALVYAANVEEATKFAQMLTEAGLKTSRYSSVDPNRRRILNMFARNQLDALVSINCLDEGVDIPDAETAVIAASDASERQFIQRRGRVLRTSAGKRQARIHDFLVLPPDLDKPVKIFRNEISRVAEFSRYARNSEGVTAALSRLMEPYGYALSQVLVELGR
jgi:superfamily II DNA or RNA helicase